MQQHARVLADRIHHNRIFEASSNLAKNLDAFTLQTTERGGQTRYMMHMKSLEFVSHT
ncbi:hypothetical protein AGR7A_Lc10047 [Agrobacterium deltaense NCPPB 1641]|uniref:Uncharacterized protein n=1 Tax=Agrobacterium deltaense NCPPB 1641 TaxID=1183425 RepID=A0A1S7TRW6_9HYPH|nr:hypothetical protein AGR7A_Lc10047 [Agrobacterium deltaense NCPPB 1641]